jgi:hypothetical protein
MSSRSCRRSCGPYLGHERGGSSASAGAPAMRIGAAGRVITLAQRDLYGAQVACTPMWGVSAQSSVVDVHLQVEKGGESWLGH